MKTMKTKTKYQDGGANGKGKLGPALGIGTTVSSAAGLITKMIVDKVKSKKAAKAEEEKKKAVEAAKKMTMKKMGGAKKYQPGGPTTSTAVPTTPPAGPRDPRMTISSGASAPQPYSVDTPTYGGKPLTQTQVNDLNKKARIDRAMGRSKYGGAKTKFMTGGMVNSNAKVSALKSAGSNGVKSGVNPKAKASTTAKGKTGGTSKAPTKATPTKNKRK